MPTDQTSHARREGDIRLPSSRTPVGARHPQLRVDLRAAGPLWTAAVVSAVDGIIEVMAICLDCDREMRTAPTCVVSTLHLAGAPFPLTPYGRDGPSVPSGGRCGDCGVEPGGFHHLGCDLQRCPRCQRQLLSCGCPFDELGGVGDGEL